MWRTVKYLFGLYCLLTLSVFAVGIALLCKNLATPGKGFEFQLSGNLWCLDYEDHRICLASFRQREMTLSERITWMLRTVELPPHQQVFDTSMVGGRPGAEEPLVRVRWRHLCMPFGVVSVLFVGTALSCIGRVVWQARHLRHRSRGQCCVCGYDLRASPSRCPECGAAI